MGEDSIAYQLPVSSFQLRASPFALELRDRHRNSIARRVRRVAHKWENSNKSLGINIKAGSWQLEAHR
jgi:hypothetical protein